MKFKNDGCGFRDLRVEDDDAHRITLSIGTTDPKRAGFIGVLSGRDYAAFSMSRRKMRAFAKAILKETEK